MLHPYSIYNPSALVVVYFPFYYDGPILICSVGIVLPFICRPLWTMRPNPGASKSNVSRCMLPIYKMMI